MLIHQLCRLIAIDVFFSVSCSNEGHDKVSLSKCLNIKLYLYWNVSVLSHSHLPSSLSSVTSQFTNSLWACSYVPQLWNKLPHSDHVMCQFLLHAEHSPYRRAYALILVMLRPSVLRCCLGLLTCKTHYRVGEPTAAWQFVDIRQHRSFDSGRQYVSCGQQQPPSSGAPVNKMAVIYHEGERDPSRFSVWWNSSSLRDIFVPPYTQRLTGSSWQ